MKISQLFKLPFIIIGVLIFISSCDYSPEKVKFKRYRVAGERLFEQHCANCHQKNGEGLRGLYPPLAGSDYLKNEFEKSICIIKNGTNDTLTVNGKVYNLPMPSIDLGNIEVAEIVTFVYNSWGNEKGLIDVKEIESLLKSCE